jgi:hypothetical protein
MASEATWVKTAPRATAEGLTGGRSGGENHVSGYFNDVVGAVIIVARCRSRCGSLAELDEKLSDEKLARDDICYDSARALGEVRDLQERVPDMLMVLRWVLRW